MVTMINKIKFFSWLKLWHHSKNSSSGESNSSTHNGHQAEQPSRHSIAKYGKREWMRHWNLLHLDKRSCAQTKDVYTVGQQHHLQGRCRSQLESASDHLAQSTTAAMPDHAAHLSIRSNSLDLDEKEKETHSVVILLGHKQHHEGIAIMESLKANTTVGDVAKRETTVLDVAAAAAATPGGLKNKVLPLTTQENVVVDTTTRTPTTNTGDSVDASGTDDRNRSSEDVPLSLKRIVARPETIRRTGSLCLKQLHSAKISFPESPKSPPRDIKWRKLLSYSRSGSPRSPSCLSQQGEWSREQRGSTHHQKGSYSTMGSPWNSQAGGNRGHIHRRSSFKSTYNQGQWITTDSDCKSLAEALDTYGCVCICITRSYACGKETHFPLCFMNFCRRGSHSLLGAVGGRGLPAPTASPPTAPS